MKNLLQRLTLTIICVGVYGFLSAQLNPSENSSSKKNNVHLAGGIGIGTQLYNAYGIEDRSVSPMWNIHGNATITLKRKFSLPFSFTIGRQGSSGSYPTFKRIGISPKYKWAKIHLGWRNISFSDYTLAGRTFYGLGIEMNPGLLRVAAMKGRLNKQLDYVDKENINVSSHIFKRTAYAGKIGLGTDDNFIDIIYFKANDDPESVLLLRSDSLPDPAENAIIGLNGRFSISSQLKFFGEFASSIYTRDISSSLSEKKYPSIAKNIIQPRLSSRANYAIKGGIEILGKRWKTSLQYERIMPEYNSMGAYYFREDSERITFSPTFILFANKFRFNGAIGIQRNNLLKIKAQTTKNFIARGSISYTANNVFGVNMSFNSFNIRQEEGNIRLDDTIRISQINSNYSLSPYWVWNDDNSLVKTFNISANFQNLNDKNPFTREFTDMSTWFFNAIYSQTYTTTNLSWNIGSNYNIIQISTLSTKRYGVTLGVNKSYKNNILNINFSSSLNLNSVEGNSDGRLLSNNIGIRYAPFEKHAFSMNSNIIRNNSKRFDDYTEVIFNLSYQYSFN